MRKNLKNNLKKGLSLFLSFLMIVTSFVFAPEMFSLKAEAATAGKYDVIIKWTLTSNDDDSYSKYNGWDNVEINNNNNCFGISLFFKTNNGTGTEYEVWWSIGNGNVSTGQETGAGATMTKSTGHTYSTEGGIYECKATIPGFPTKIYAMADGKNVTGDCKYTINSVGVRANGSSGGYTDIWAGSAYLATTKKLKYVQFNNSRIEVYDDGKSTSNKSNAKVDKTGGNGWAYPTASRIAFTGTPISVTIPKTGSTTANTGTATAYDQYGVVMAAEPSYYLRSSAPSSAQTSSSTTNLNNCSISGKTITVPSTAKMSGTTDSKNLYVHASLGSAYANRVLILNDPEYEFTFKNDNGGDDVTLAPAVGTQSQGTKYGHYFGMNPFGSRTGFTFLGYFRDNNIADSYEADNTDGKDSLKLKSTTIYDGDYTWYAAWQANQYTATFKFKKERNGELADAIWSKTQYYNSALTAPTDPDVPATINIGEDYTYTFKGWSPEVPAKMPAHDGVYTATYDRTVNYANLDALNTQISSAESIKNQTDYNNKYTAASRAALDNAYTAANSAKNAGMLKSQQQTVDDLTTALSSAISNLETNKYTVIFKNHDGSIVPGGNFDVPYGGSVTKPADPTKAYDATNHYTFSGWTGSDISALNNVTSDLTYTAGFAAAGHTYDTTTIDSTCTSAGSIKYTCACGYSYTVATDVAQHTWSTGKKVIKEATCTEAGAKAFQCTKCNVYQEGSIEAIDPVGHSWNSGTITKNPTCDETGSKTYACTRCSATKVEILDATSHDWETTHTEDFPATCISAGQKSYHCSKCDSVKADSKKAIAKLGHDLGSAYTEIPATCTEAGFKYKECSRCDYTGNHEVIPATGHTWQGATAENPEGWVTVSEATCTTKGQKKHICGTCSTEKYDDIPVKGHKWVVDDITAANVLDTLNSTYDENTDLPYVKYVKATCTDSGYWLLTCQHNCGMTHIVSNKAADPTTSHNWVLSSNASETYAPTCTDAGNNHYDCSTCDAVKDEEVSAIGHSYVTTDIAVLRDKIKGINGASMTPEEWTYVTPVTPDCSHSGYYIMHCKNGCTETITLVDDKQPATGNHNWYINESDTTKPQTDADGWIINLNGTDPADAADMQEYLPVAATCTADGKHTRFCDDCGEAVTEVIPKTGHKWIAPLDETSLRAKYAETGADITGVLEYTEKTCHNSGYWTVYCQNNGCGENVTVLDSKNPSTGHGWIKVEGEGKTKVPTCTDDGHETYKCSDCGTEEQRTLPKTGHDWIASLDEASLRAKYAETGADITGVLEYTAKTCQNAGYWTAYCQNGCGEKVTVRDSENPATGHVWADATDANPDGWVIDEDANCTAEGSKHRTCTYNCGADGQPTTETEVIPAKGHTWPTGKETPVYESIKDLDVAATPNLDYVEATCKNAGYWVCTCSECSRKLEVLDTAHPATGHVWDTTLDGADTEGWVVVTQEDCENDGSKTRKCVHFDVCGEQETVEIPKLGHDWGDWTQVDNADGTSTLQRTCKRTGCGEVEISEKFDTNHKLEKDTEASYAPTCEETGLEVFKCVTEHRDADGNPIVCDQKVEVTIPATGHAYTVTYTWSADGSTCRAERTCANDSAHNESEEVTAASEVTTNPTCTEKGTTTYTATFTNTAFEEQTKSIEDIDALDHSWAETYIWSNDLKTCVGKRQCTHDSMHVVVEEATITCEVKPAKCEEDGLETYTATFAEGSPFTAQTATKVLTALGHAWTVTYTWSDDGKTCRADRICANDHTHDYFENATITPSVKTPATCTEMGTTTYTATFTNDGFENQTKDVVDVPALKHKWANPSYDWNTDNTVCVATRVCENDGAHIDKITVGSTNKITTEPNCTEKGVRTYTAQFTFADDGKSFTATTTTDVAALGHDFDDTIEANVSVDKAPDCINTGLKTVKCSRCDETKQFVMPELGHYWGKTEVIAPTCTEDGYTLHTCTREVNGVKCGSTYRDVPTEKLGHSWLIIKEGEPEEQTDDEGWKVDIKGNCTEPSRYSRWCQRCKTTEYKYQTIADAHTFEKSKTVEATCTTYGYDLYVCVNSYTDTNGVVHTCNATEERNIVEALGHELGDWHIVRYPTKTENGLQRRVCVREGCDYKEEQEVIFGKFYLVTFFNYDGNRAMEPAYYAENSKAGRPKQTPVRPADKGFTYTFVGWDKTDEELNKVKENLSVHAVYQSNERSYNVTYKNYDGTVLATKENVLYTKISSSYTGETPVRNADSNNTYEFSSWAMSYDTETGTAVATAYFTAKPKQSQEEDNIFKRLIDWIKGIIKQLLGKLGINI